MKALTDELARVSAVILPDWGPGNPPKLWFGRVGDKDDDRSQ